MKKIMVVYDVDPFYADRFADFINRRETVPWTVMAFTSMEYLKKYAEAEKIELLLISDEINAEDIEELGAEQVVVLTEGLENKLTEYPGVYKFQSSENIMREIMTYYSDVAGSRKLCLTSMTDIIGIYSPVGRCLKTSLAVTLGRVMAEKHKVLLINLESYSGFGRLMNREYVSDLSDIIYYYIQGILNQTRTVTAIYSYGELDYIPPARYGEDLSELKAEQMTDMIRKIASDGIYDYMVIDFGQQTRDVVNLIDLCSKIYMPVKDDSVSAAKLEEFFEYLRISDRERLSDKINRIKLPVPSNSMKGSCYYDGLLWGDFGNSVREIVRGMES